MAPGQCDWLTGQSIMMDGGNALATGGNFYELRSGATPTGRPRASASRRRTRRTRRSAEAIAPGALDAGKSRTPRVAGAPTA